MVSYSVDGYVTYLVESYLFVESYMGVDCYLTIYVDCYFVLWNGYLLPFEELTGEVTVC